MIQSLLKQTTLSSPLAAASVLKPDDGKSKRKLDADLLLTALIDAFSILVIFLLMNFSSTGEILFVNKGMELPKAARAETLDRNPVVKVEDGQISLEGKNIGGGDSLFKSLLEMHQNFKKEHPQDEFLGTITVQADRRIKYEFLNQVVVACAQAGFSDIRFAVLMK